jgi:hypothetical protein
MNLEIETIAVADLVFDSENARKHSAHNLAVISSSLQSFGQRKPVVITSSNVIVAGNGTVQAAKELGWTEVEVVRVPASWTKAQVKAFAIADNRSAELGQWDNQILLNSLMELNEVGLLGAAGFSDSELSPSTDFNGNEKSLIETLTGEPAKQEKDDESRGELLSLLNVAYGEPEYEVALGEVYEVGHHILVIADVMQGWKEYIDYLKEDVLFLPYPGPFIAIASKLDNQTALFVQPNLYLAGHLLDKYASINGKDGIKKIKSND